MEQLRSYHGLKWGDITPNLKYAHLQLHAQLKHPTWYCGEGKKKKEAKQLSTLCTKLKRLWDTIHQIGRAIQGGNAVLKSSWERWREAAEEEGTRKGAKRTQEVGKHAKGLPWKSGDSVTKLCLFKMEIFPDFLPLALAPSLHPPGAHCKR